MSEKFGSQYIPRPHASSRSSRRKLASKSDLRARFLRWQWMSKAGVIELVHRIQCRLFVGQAFHFPGARHTGRQQIKSQRRLVSQNEINRRPFILARQKRADGCFDNRLGRIVRPQRMSELTLGNESCPNRSARSNHGRNESSKVNPSHESLHYCCHSNRPIAVRQGVRACACRVLQVETA